MNTFALMQVQVDGSPDEIASISGFDFSQIVDDPQDENIEDLIVLTLLRNYFATISMSHQALPLTDMNPNSTQMLFGIVQDSSTMVGHTEGSASLVCFNERILKDLLSADLQLGEEARGLPLEEFLELARPHLPPSLEVIQNPITLRIVRATLPPPDTQIMPTALMDSSPSNYIDVFDIIKEKISNREDILEGSHTTAKYYPDGDYIEFVAECGLYFGMEETGNFQIEVDSDDSSNSNADFSIELSGVKERFNINLGNQKSFDMLSPNLDDVDYYFSSEQDESGSYRAYLSIRNISGRRLGININSDADKLLIESGWTPDEEGSGRGIIVNEIPYGISNVQFRTWNTFLAVPNYLPDTITSLERTFENCKNFDSDISDWDTSRVTSLSNTFYGCESFMQDISRWDVSNVTNMEYAFNGAYNFNSDLSRWNVGKVESFKYAFNAASYFNSDLSQWDTSSARNMFRMFSSASRFSSIVEDWDVSNVENMDYMFQPTAGELPSLPSQDLSRWCVSKVTSPMNFIGYEWTGILPIWGTCPSDGDPNDLGVSELGEPYVFSTTNVTTPTSELMLSIDMYNYTKWQLVDTDIGLVIANSRGYFAPNIRDNQSQSFEASVQLGRPKTGVSNYALYVKSDSVTFSNQGSGDTVSGTFSLTQWGTMSPNPRFILNGVTTTVPDTLSEAVTSADLMFASNNLFNQDISSWETGHLVSAARMFEGASNFNQDLSSWCVSLIPVEPDDFASYATSWTLPKPQWGTCPN